MDPDEESRQRLRALRGEAPLPSQATDEAAAAEPPARVPVRTAQDDLADAEAAEQAAATGDAAAAAEAQPSGAAGDGDGAAAPAAAAADAEEDSDDEFAGAARHVLCGRTSKALALREGMLRCGICQRLSLQSDGRAVSW